MKLISLFISLLVGTTLYAEKTNSTKVLMVLSSHQELGNTGKTTGYYLSEVTHAYAVFEEAGYQIDLVSTKGGLPPVDGFDLEDTTNKKYWNDKDFQKKLKNTLTPSEVNYQDYSVIYYAGGHGTMWNFPNNEELSTLAQKIYENNGIVGAVCHGPSGLLNIQLSNGEYLVAGKEVSGFTNQEEITVKLEEVVPFSLEDELLNRGALIRKGANFTEMVSVDQRLVTGQNPASAHKVATEIVTLINSQK